MTRQQKEILSSYKIKDIYPEWWKFWKKDAAEFLRQFISIKLQTAELRHKTDFWLALMSYQNTNESYCPICKEIVNVCWHTSGSDSYSIECPYCEYVFDED